VRDRKRFNKGEIAWHWQNDPRIIWPAEDCCWHCGRPTSFVQRAHITPLCEGGKDEIANIHLLCVTCHQDSEYLSGERYWKWLAADQCHPVQWVRRNLASLEAKGIITPEERKLIEDCATNEVNAASRQA
jgi:hypothetical protein